MYKNEIYEKSAYWPLNTKTSKIKLCDYVKEDNIKTSETIDFSF